MLARLPALPHILAFRVLFPQEVVSWLASAVLLMELVCCWLSSQGDNGRVVLLLRRRLVRIPDVSRCVQNLSILLDLHSLFLLELLCL